MLSAKQDIIDQLKKHILFLQGLEPPHDHSIKIRLGPIDESFPAGNFPLAVIHEFITGGEEDLSATKGFISHLLSELINRKGICIWINSKTIFPPALRSFGVDPDKVVFINVKKEKEILWVMEEALKCEGLAGVVGELKEINFTESRRLQLAVEKSRVTGFIIRDEPRSIGINACVSRWKISPLASGSANNLPGIGFPRWNIELLKIRNGKPGVWQMEWSYGQLHRVPGLITLVPQEQKKKAG
ncbi:MAG TPA: hypothetical protein VJ765_15345 [Chitinophagaceae bacterium]|nr:hypothetical protein [Chitinophagaceae bacterium]